MPQLQLAIHPHPVLRQKSKPITRVDQNLREVIAQMFDVMYEYRGVGLAANQVELPLRVFVCNPIGERGQGPEMVFLNPVLSRGKGIEESEEGCLSLPGIRAPVRRNKTVWVNGYDLMGNEINQEFSGFMARIVQHETDHLDGVLFLDRLLPEKLNEYGEDIDELVQDYQSRQRTGSLPSDQELLARAKAWEVQYGA
jgi:peptide deformylase